MMAEKETTITSENVEYDPKGKSEKPRTVIPKLPSLLVGLFISWGLYNRCMFNQYINPVVVSYFAIIGLSCFEIVGLPVSKLRDKI